MNNCKWVKAFDGHYHISCVNKTGMRGNGNFKPDAESKITKWDFTYCPYCGRKIKIVKSKEGER